MMRLFMTEIAHSLYSVSPLVRKVLIDKLIILTDAVLRELREFKLLLLAIAVCWKCSLLGSSPHTCITPITQSPRHIQEPVREDFIIK